VFDGYCRILIVSRHIGMASIKLMQLIHSTFRKLMHFVQQTIRDGFTF